MNFKKIVAITLLLLAILTISAVSAAEDADALAVDDGGDEQIIETPVDDVEMISTDESNEVLQDPAPEDFNVVIKSEANINSKDAVVSFNLPNYVKEKNSSVYPDVYNDHVEVSVEGGSSFRFYNTGGETSINLTIDDLYIFFEDDYNITVYYNSHDSNIENLKIASGTLKVTESAVLTADNFIESYDLAVEAGDDYLCTVFDTQTASGLNGQVSISANGTQIYSKTFKGSGTQSIAIYGSDLTGNLNGEYNIKITYKRTADGKEYSKNAVVTFKNIGTDTPTDGTGDVTPIATSISASAISIVYNQNKNLVATLKDANGKAISGVDVFISIMGVKYPLKTDNNGQIKQSLSSLPPKTHNITFAFDGNSNYLKSTKTVKVTVKKATPKITAKAKTFKKSVKTKKYAITLKNNLNKVMKNTKVTIKVNKKTYTAKTNSKGVATFKITKLAKKGTFKSVITYKGNSYYNKVIKKVNIKVK